MVIRYIILFLIFLYSLNLQAQNKDKPNRPKDKDCPPGQIKKEVNKHWKCVDEEPLAVDLLYFKSQVIKDSIWLYWSTANEINNNYFQVEGSNDGKLFNTIIQIPSICSNSNTQLFYKTSVKQFKYYRLIQYDLDGSKTIYSVIFVYFKLSNYQLKNSYDAIGRKIK